MSRAGGTVFLVLALSGAGQAGGTLSLPPVAEDMGTHAACVAAIEKAYAQDRQAIATRTIAPDGTTREVTLETAGPQRKGADGLEYQATLWFHHGRPHQALNQLEITHSFERFRRLCSGGQLKTTQTKGFTLSTFEPLEPAKP